MGYNRFHSWVEVRPNPIGGAEKKPLRILFSDSLETRFQGFHLIGTPYHLELADTGWQLEHLLRRASQPYDVVFLSPYMAIEGKTSPSATVEMVQKYAKMVRTAICISPHGDDAAALVVGLRSVGIPSGWVPIIPTDLNRHILTPLEAPKPQPILIGE